MQFKLRISLFGFQSLLSQLEKYGVKAKCPRFFKQQKKSSKINCLDFCFSLFTGLIFPIKKDKMLIKIHSGDFEHVR